MPPIKEIAQNATDAHSEHRSQIRPDVGDISFAAGFASIAASIAIWGVNRATDDRAHAERFGIFVGLWAPTFFILSGRLDRYAELLEKSKLA